MAGKQGKKGRKFDRNRKSKGNQMYVMSDRRTLNKLRKMKQHVKAHPNDKSAASKVDAFKTQGKSVFAPATYPRIPKVAERVKHVTDQPTAENFRRFPVLYEVRAEGVTLDVTPHMSDALKCFLKSSANKMLLSRTTDRGVPKVLKNERAVPNKQFEIEMRRHASLSTRAS